MIMMKWSNKHTNNLTKKSIFTDFWDSPPPFWTMPERKGIFCGCLPQETFKVIFPVVFFSVWKCAKYGKFWGIAVNQIFWQTAMLSWQLPWCWINIAAHMGKEWEKRERQRYSTFRKVEGWIFAAIIENWCSPVGKFMWNHISQPFKLISERSTQPDKSTGVRDVSQNLSPHTFPAEPSAQM